MTERRDSPLQRFTLGMGGKMHGDDAGAWVRYEDVRPFLSATGTPTAWRVWSKDRKILRGIYQELSAETRAVMDSDGDHIEPLYSAPAVVAPTEGVRDAARYRWLRVNGFWDGLSFRFPEVRGFTLDESVDAGIAAMNAGNKP